MDNDILYDPVLADLIERREGEPFQAYSAFAFFTKLSEGERFAPDANTIVAGHFTTTAQQIKNWRENWEWDFRASLIDSYGITTALSNTIKLLKEDDKAFVQINREFKEKIISARGQLLDVLLEQIGKAREMEWKVSDIVAVFKAIGQADKLGATNTLNLMDSLSAQRNRIKDMSDEELQKHMKEYEEREKKLLIEGGTQ